MGLTPGWRWAGRVLLALATVATLLPLAMLVLNSFKGEGEIVGGFTLLPDRPTLENFRRIAENRHEVPILRWFLNSVVVAGGATALVVLLDSMAAFAIARLRVRGGGLLAVVIVATLFIPVHVVLVPLYLVMERLRLVDTLWALILPAGAGAFGVFLLLQFMRDLPGVLEDAARIDGCSSWGVYRHVTLPECKSALAVLAIFVFNATWNEFLLPLIMTDSLSMRTLPVGLALFQSAYVTDFGLTMAACVLSTAPVLLVFLVFQRQIVAGISLTGFK